MGTEGCDGLWTNRIKRLGNPLHLEAGKSCAAGAFIPASRWKLLGERGTCRGRLFHDPLRATESSFLPTLPPYNHLSPSVLLLSLPFPGAPFLILTPARREWVNSFIFSGSGSECSHFKRLLVGAIAQFGVAELTIKYIGAWQCSAGVGMEPCAMLMTDLTQGQPTATEQ